MSRISMLHPAAGTAQSAAVSGARRTWEVSPETPARPPDRDAYVPEEPREPSGRYRPARDEEGRPSIRVDRAETCTVNTDRVDRELEGLRQKQAKLEQALASQTDEAKRSDLERQLSQVQGELAQKDNDGYRRRHADVS